MITYDLSGKVALVTGGRKGIGYAIAKRLAQAGANVAIASRNESEVKKAAQSLSSFGVESIGIGVDVSNIAEAQKIPSLVAERFKRLDILVNNSGISIPTPALEVTEKIWDKILDTNLKGMFFCSQSACRQMMNQGGGTIINIASVQSVVAQRNQAPYGSSKGGIAMMTKVLALEWAQYDIRVNVIAPGSIRTDINREYLARPENLRKNLSMIPLNRIGDPEDIAGMAVFLCTDDASYITGTTIFIDGGWTIE